MQKIYNILDSYGYITPTSKVFLGVSFSWKKEIILSSVFKQLFNCVQFNINPHSRYSHV